jgi:hypothetical protein
MLDVRASTLRDDLYRSKPTIKIPGNCPSEFLVWTGVADEQEAIANDSGVSVHDNAFTNLAGASGFVIERTGFQDFFIGTSLIGIPVALLAWFVWRNHPPVVVPQ